MTIDVLKYSQQMTPALQLPRLLSPTHPLTPAPVTPHLCIDCEHHTGGSNAHFCTREIHQEISLVTGQQVTKGKALECWSEREFIQGFDAPLNCGISAVYFSPKVKEPLDNTPGRADIGL